MIYIFFFIYRLFLIPIIALALPVLAIFNSKVRLGLSLRMKAGKLRYPLSERPFWIHASSGEFEYAKPVIRQLKMVFPNVPILVTYFSPSYKDQVARFPGVDRFEPLPLDLPGAIHSFLSFHKPRALLIARTDLWPELLWQVSQRRIPSLLFSHTRKKAPPALNFYFRVIYSLLTEIFAVSSADAVEIAKTSPSPFLVAGDTRYDQVAIRLHESRRLPASLDSLFPIGEFVVIAGSTWEDDEQVLLPAFAALKAFPLRFVIVPHETDEKHISTLQKMAADSNLMLRLSSSTSNESARADIAVVDQKGYLADLYPNANVAFVGGSFKRKVHSVMEPLGAGKIVIVGPHYTNNREAIEFNEIKVFEDIRAVNVVHNSQELEKLLIQISALSAESRKSAEAAIRREFERRLGATAKVIDWCEFHLETSGTLNIPHA